MHRWVTHPCAPRTDSRARPATPPCSRMCMCTCICPQCGAAGGAGCMEGVCFRARTHNRHARSIQLFQERRICQACRLTHSPSSHLPAVQGARLPDQVDGLTERDACVGNAEGWWSYHSRVQRGRARATTATQHGTRRNMVRTQWQRRTSVAHAVQCTHGTAMAMHQN